MMGLRRRRWNTGQLLVNQLLVLHRKTGLHDHWVYVVPDWGSSFLDLYISNEFMIADVEMAENSECGMIGKLATCVN